MAKLWLKVINPVFGSDQMETEGLVFATIVIVNDQQVRRCFSRRNFSQQRSAVHASSTDVFGQDPIRVKPSTTRFRLGVIPVGETEFLVRPHQVSRR